MNPSDRRDAPTPIHADTHTVVPISHVILEPAPFDRIKKNSIQKVKNTTTGKK